MRIIKICIWKCIAHIFIYIINNIYKYLTYIIQTTHQTTLIYLKNYVISLKIIVLMIDKKRYENKIKQTRQQVLFTIFILLSIKTHLSITSCGRDSSHFSLTV